MTSGSRAGLSGGELFLLLAVMAVVAVIVLLFYVLVYLAAFAAGAGVLFGSFKATSNYVKSFKSHVIDSNKSES